MAIATDALFLLTSPEPERKKVFGTGFAVAQQDEKLFILTCAHVVEQLEGKVMVGSLTAELVAAGSSNVVDLALLSIPCHEARTMLNRLGQARPGMTFQLCGYSPFSGAKENHVLRPIQGRLGKAIFFEPSGKGRVPAWDIQVQDDDFSKLQGGYSGSPLCDDKGRLLAVVSHNADPAAGQRGHAVAIANLKRICPEIAQLMPDFAHLDTADRVQEVMNRLTERTYEILEIIQAVGCKLQQMKQDGVQDKDEVLLDTIEQFLDKEISAEDFIRFFKQADQPAEAKPDYAKLASQLNQGQVILCLGQELSPLLGAGIPCTAELISKLAFEENFHGPLSEICEQKEIAPESCRADLVNELHGLFCSAAKCPPLPLYELLAGLKQPFIVISTAYDELLEQSLQGRRNFVVICPNMEEKNCLLLYSDGREITCTPEDISQHKPLENGYAVIYRLRGGIVGSREHLLLSERDYFLFNRLMEKQFPDYIGSRLKSTLCSLWFLGHHPQSWEERLLTRFLKNFQHEMASSLAVQEQLSPFARSFWQHLKGRVRVFELSLAEFAAELVKEAAA